jgi:hypothetical protein
MREDLASMGGSISDDDFTSIILGSVPASYDTYIAAITATSSLLAQTIKSPKSKKDEQDAAFTAGQSSEKGKKGGEGSKKSKKGMRCFNCKKLGHIARDCWASGGGAEGKGPKQKGQDKGKGKGKETAAKADEKGGSDSDAVWMVSTGNDAIDEDNKVASWLYDCGGEGGGEYELYQQVRSQVIAPVVSTLLNRSP